VPHRVTIGERTLKEGKVEYQHRRDSAAKPVALAEVAALLRSRLAA
jgi:prolyl-tRNA synthetase